jgi:dTDP-4-amino-4,6-dideoxygalactose transaminase
MEIPIARPVLEKEEKDAVMQVMSSGILTQGPKLEEFERAFARYVGVKHAIAVNSGTAALHVAVVALGLGPGDEVITTPFTFNSTADCILHVGAKPVFADIDRRTYNLDVGAVERKITPKTKAILPVHLYGQTVEADALRELADKQGIAILEDACQAHGAEYSGKRAGALGAMGVFSFYPTKNMTTAEGGMVTTDDDRLAEAACVFRNIGQRSRYDQVMLGFNYRMTEMSAAIGIEQLKKLDMYNARRIENAKFFSDRFSKLDGVEIPYVMPEAKHVFHQYTLRVAHGIGRDEFERRLNAAGVGTRVYYPQPVTMQPIYKQMGFYKPMPESEKAALEVVSIPVYPSLTQTELDYVAEQVARSLNS